MFASGTGPHDCRTSQSRTFTQFNHKQDFYLHYNTVDECIVGVICLNIDFFLILS